MGFESLAQPLAFVGLVIATELYYLLIRRRRREAEAAYSLELEQSRQRAAMRFRHMRRRDDR